MQRLRISAISYLNTAPLMWDFEHGEAGSNFDISYTLPSRCAAALHAGDADIGIIPAAAYTTISDLLIIPGVAIASRQPVRSILLASKLPMDQIRSVAMDTSSMTSVALTKVLFAYWWRREVTFSAMNPDLDRMLDRHDAALVIGDPALQVDRSRYLTFDLAEEWIRFTNKPFVFAFWAIRAAALTGSKSTMDLPGMFQQSRDHGLQPENLELIVKEWAPKLALSENDIRTYLTENIYYLLSSDCLAGLELFYSYAKQCQALPATPELRFLDAPRPALK